MKIKFTLPAFTALLLASSCGFAQAPAEGVPKDYPLKKCVISGETLGEHGKPVKVTSAGTDVYLLQILCERFQQRCGEIRQNGQGRRSPKIGASFSASAARDLGLGRFFYGFSWAFILWKIANITMYWFDEKYA